MLRETDTDVLFAVQKAIQDLDGVETGVDGVPSMNAEEDRDNERKLREERLIASMEEQVKMSFDLFYINNCNVRKCIFKELGQTDLSHVGSCLIFSPLFCFSFTSRLTLTCLRRRRQRSTTFRCRTESGSDT
jgi:hypothetical protein